MTQDFYHRLAPYFHLRYANWEASIALGLAHLGYNLTASDLSPAAVARARAEAEARRLAIASAVADLRRLSSAFDRQFAAVIACDNAIPHLLSDEEIGAAFA